MKFKIYLEIAKSQSIVGISDSLYLIKLGECVPALKLDIIYYLQRTKQCQKYNSRAQLTYWKIAVSAFRTVSSIERNRRNRKIFLDRKT